MSVHVRYETPEDVSNKIYELVQACNGGRIKRGDEFCTARAIGSVRADASTFASAPSGSFVASTAAAACAGPSAL